MIEIKSPKDLKHYIVHWTWAEGETTEDGRARATKAALDAYHEMLDLKKAEDPRLEKLLEPIRAYFEEGTFTRKKYPTSLGSSGGGSPNWHTIFWATDTQLKNWYEHYKDVLQIKQIREILTADDFDDMWEKNEIPWTYFLERSIDRFSRARQRG